MNEELKQRLDINSVAPEAYKALRALDAFAGSGTLDEALMELVRVKVSQINHCAYCLDIHVPKALAAGVSQRKLDIVAAWHEAPYLFSSREQAALLLAEEVTLISKGGVSDRTWQKVSAEFSEKETVELIILINGINSWNRTAISIQQALKP